MEQKTKYTHIKKAERLAISLLESIRNYQNY